jgi:hypothetical protein
LLNSRHSKPLNFWDGKGMGRGGNNQNSKI